ncbi:MAG: FapA family protein [Lachnospiraceae bacterium]|nr:FapA family protein [Lachnospiraceae bacterium]
MIEVKISADGMLAEVAVQPEEGEIISTDSILAAINIEGVQAGIDEKAIKEIVEEKLYGQYVTVAKGKPAVDGKDGYYEYFFAVNAGKGVPRIREDGSVDYSRVITNVSEGDLVAEYHPHTNGVFGYNVYATMLPPVKGKALNPFRVKDVRQDENRYYAEKSGFVSIDDHTLAIHNVLEIKGDADYTMGNISFNGDIHVMGNILPGIEVRAKGSVIVDGVVGDSKVYAGKDVIIGNGIHGKGEGTTYVEAEGCLKTNFASHAHIRVGGNVELNYSVGSEIEAEGMVTVTGDKGAIIGGTVLAVKGVEAKVYGNDFGILTEINVGYSKKTKEALMFHKKQLQEMEESLATYSPGEQPAYLVKMINVAKKQIWEMEHKQMEDKTSPAIIHDQIYPGVRIRLGGLLATDMTGRQNIELRNIKNRIYCKRVGTFSRAEIAVGIVERDVEELTREKPHVLVVDDDVRMLRTIYQILKNDYQVSVTKGGSEARKFLLTNEVKLILLDYMMPDENGVEVLKSLRVNESTAKIPVVFLTGLDDKKKIMECLSLKPAGYIMKPVESEKLVTKLKAILG